MRRVARALAVAGIAGALVAVPATPAGACSCVARSVAEQMQAAEVVFVGTAREVGAVGAEPASLRAEFDVAAVYKGTAGRRADVVTPGGEAACGAPFAEGGRYVVFADRAGDAFATTLCSGTTSDTTVLAGFTPLARSSPRGTPGGGGSRALPLALAGALLAAAAAGVVASARRRTSRA